MLVRGVRVDILTQIAISFVPAVIGFLAAGLLARARVFYRYGYLRVMLAPYRRIQIITSSVEVAEFTFATDGKSHTHLSPKNVLFMPMAEGVAIGQLIDLLRKVNRKATIELVTAGSHDPRSPIFSIGGPSVNSFSGSVLASEFKDFRIEYPEAKRARWDGMTFETQRNSLSDELVRDHGFIFITKTSRQAPCVVLCGVLAFGTAMTVEILSESSRKSQLASLVKSGSKGFVAVEGRVVGFDTADVTIEVCKPMLNK